MRSIGALYVFCWLVVWSKAGVLNRRIRTQTQYNFDEAKINILIES